MGGNLRSVLPAFEFDLTLLSNYIDDTNLIELADDEFVEEIIEVLMPLNPIHLQIVEYMVLPLTVRIIDMINNYLRHQM